MNSRYLKQLRVCLAVAFFIPTAFLFFDIWETGLRNLSDKLLFLQFVPSLLAFAHSLSAGATGFLIVLLLTFFFGRVYCSVICPMGIFQDLISRFFSRKAKPGYKFSPPHRILRYTLLALTLLTFAVGGNLMLNLLDPFSSFGRIAATLFRPLVIVFNNLAAPLAESFGIHALYRVPWPGLVLLSIVVSLLTLTLVGWMSARHGRLYCNTVCPVGTLLGLVSRISLFRISLDPEACRSCGQCRRVCKAGCIDVKNRQVDLSRCVSCFNCLGVCPDNAMIYRAISFKNCLPPTARMKDSPESHQKERRIFMLALAAGGMGLASNRAGAQTPLPPIQAKPTTIPEQRTSPLSPPGSVSITRYNSICTACHLCVSACPSRVLVPSILSFGLSGMLQPQMDFSSGHCNYDCTVCSQVCPSSAILPLSIENKQQTQVGIARFIKENCVVYTDNTNCGACSEHCPTKAVHMVPYLNAAGRKLVIPKVNEAICVGCGGCEHACPTRPFRAIYVDGNKIHKKAEKPVVQKLPVSTEEDFPF